ncbi:hypothetical protein ABPG74_004045 [Tetrahymena malaccensis]
MKSILSNSKKLDQTDFQSTLKRNNANQLAASQSRKVQINEPDENKVKEDQYIEKLHAHINFLNKTVKEMKKKQDEYKNGLVDMLSKDAKPLPDLATDSQQKYKEMKQALICQINALENIKAKTINKNLGLMKKKDKIKQLLEELERKHNEIEQFNKKRIQEIKEKYKKEKDRREEMDEEVEKWRMQYEKNCQEYEQRMKEIQEKKFHEELVNQRYLQEKQLEEEDEIERRKEHEEVEKKIKELKDFQENDFKYKDLKKKNQELSETLRELGENYEKFRYQSYELDHLIKLGDQEKEKEADERKKLRDEYDKQLTILEEYKRKNREKVEKQFDTAVCPALTEVQKKLNKIKRTAKEIQDKYVQNDANYKRLKIEQMKKAYQIERSKLRVQELKTQSNQLNQEVNEREVEYLELANRITELDQRISKLRKEEEKLSKANQKLVIEQEYLEIKADNYEKTVKLQDLVQELEFSELEKAHQSNLQFMEGLKSLKGLKDEVRMQNLSFYSQQQ